MIKISKYLDADLVTFLDVDTRDEALHTLVEMVHNAHLIKDKEAFYNAIIEREKNKAVDLAHALDESLFKRTSFFLHALHGLLFRIILLA